MGGLQRFIALGCAMVYHIIASNRGAASSLVFNFALAAVLDG